MLPSPPQTTRPHVRIARYKVGGFVHAREDDMGSGDRRRGYLLRIAAARGVRTFARRGKCNHRGWLKVKWTPHRACRGAPACAVRHLVQGRLQWHRGSHTRDERVHTPEKFLRTKRVIWGWVLLHHRTIIPSICKLASTKPPNRSVSDASEAHSDMRRECDCMQQRYTSLPKGRA